jgi:N-glycosylase/DNA lyase
VGGGVTVSGGERDAAAWRQYFDMDFDYAAARASLGAEGYLAEAAEFGAGIRILRQDKWEALCSFIVSQCNNIPRIKKIIETMCRLFGEPIPFEGGALHSFPSPQRLAALSEEELAPLRCGYRAPYILNAARAVADGTLDLDAVARMDALSALRALKALPGVGDKVAGCVALFGFHMMGAFPVDTWMKKVIKEQYGGKLDVSAFGEYAGLAQQYLFFHARSAGRNAAV